LKKFKLRDYQQEAVDAAINHMKTTLSSCLLELATGAGKSLIVSEIAKQINQISSGKRVLCLAPSKELVEQNRERYLKTGEPASMFSASAGRKCLKHPVVFGTPQTVLGSISKFGGDFAAVVLDEAHGITPTLIKIISQLKEKNDKLRVIGLTATPYRMKTGYIFRVWPDGKSNTEDKAANPYFDKLLYQVPAAHLIARGYLTKPVTESLDKAYDTSGLILKPTGKFDASTVSQAFEGKGRLTAEIVADVVQKSTYANGVMFFGASIQHANEICESLPPDQWRMISGETKKKEREKIINDFKLMRFKYIVNVDVLTTGFDAPHVDVVAILRSTESAGLFQQIIGRGARLFERKAFFSVLDYAKNIERHGLQDDIFTPEIKVSMASEGKLMIGAQCPKCGFENEFAGRPNPENFEVDAQGFFLDLSGRRIEYEEGKHLPAHFGRRCQSYEVGKFGLEQCSHRYDFKECLECGHENDIAARRCKKCKVELVDPNEKLTIEFQKAKSSARVATSDKVINMSVQPWVSQSGGNSLRVDITTEFRTFPFWINPNSNNTKAVRKWREFVNAIMPNNDNDNSTIEDVVNWVKGKKITPLTTITAMKIGSFFEVMAYNNPEDILKDEV